MAGDSIKVRVTGNALSNPKTTVQPETNRVELAQIRRYIKIILTHKIVLHILPKLKLPCD